jgi:hypothetical protein
MPHRTSKFNAAQHPRTIHGAACTNDNKSRTLLTAPELRIVLRSVTFVDATTLHCRDTT